MKIFKAAILLAAFCILTPQSAYAGAQTGDSLVTWNTATNTEGPAFTKAAVTVTGVDKSGNYTYYGVDIGIFKEDGTTIYMKRIPTNYLKINITDFGNITRYDYNQTYVIGYRDLYQPIGSNASPVIEDAPWKRVSSSYFRVKSAIPNIPVSLSATGGTTAKGERIIVTWNANGNGSGVSYELDASNDNINFANIYSGTNTTYTQTGLSPSVTKYYRVRAKSGSNVYCAYTAAVQGNTLASPAITRTVASSGVNSGKARVQLSWSTVTGADGYRIWVWDGGNYRAHDIGNVTSWDSNTAKIYPTAAQLAAWSGTTDPFRWSGDGTTFSSSWNPMYAKANAGYQTYSYYSWIHVAALDSLGNQSGGVWAGASSACGTLPDTDAPNTPGAPTIGTVTTTSIALSGTAADKYMTANYPGSGIAANGYYFRNNTAAAVSGWTSSSYTFSSLNPNTRYTFSVRACDNNSNYTGFSTAVSKYTLADVPANLNIAFNNSGGNKWTVSWTGNGTDYYLQWSNDNSNWLNIGWTGGATAYTDTSNSAVTQRYYRVKAKNGDNIDTAYCTSTRAPIVPTLNVPTVTGLITYGEDVALSDTGTDIDEAAYRIFYTTAVTPPSITNGDTPGADWIDSGIANPMNVLSSTSITQIIAGTTYSNVNWTYLTFKVGAASQDNIWVANYSTAYSLSSDANSYINYVGHNQIIKVLSTNKNIIVSDPDTPVQQYGPYDSATLNGLDSSNIFIDSDIVKYRLEFDVLRPAPIKEVEILFDFNLFNEDGVELPLQALSPSQVVLEKMQTDGTFTLIKDLNSSYTKQSRNRYIVTLGNDNSGNPIIATNGVGRYAIEYSGRLNITQYNMGAIFLMRNEAQMSIYSVGRIYPDTLEPKRPGRKFYIETKVSKQHVIYR